MGETLSEQDNPSRGRPRRSRIAKAKGFGAAKKAYYGCSASTLTTAQIALLAGLPLNPSLDPIAHPDRAAKRRQYILRVLAEAGVISSAEADNAAAEDAEAAVVPQEALCP